MGYCQIHTRSSDHRHPVRNRSATWQIGDNYQDSNPGPQPVTCFISVYGNCISLALNNVMFGHMCYFINISSKYLVSECSEIQRSWHVDCPSLEMFVIQNVKLLKICNGDTLVNGLIAHGMFLALSIYPFGFITAVAVFRKPNAIALCFSIDLFPYFLLSWLLVLLPSTFFLNVLFFFSPVVPIP